MKKLLRAVLLPAMLLALSLVSAVSVQAAARPQKISLNAKSTTKYVGQKFTLKAKVSPAAAAGAKITWKSSNSKVATVDSAGRVTLTGAGTVKIVAETSNGKRAVCTVRSQRYSISGRTVKVATPGGAIRTYHAYYQKDYGHGWYRHHGCVTTAVAIAASAYGKKYSPVTIHKGSASKTYSEKYAVINMGRKSELSSGYGKTAISVRTASEILTNMGIPNRAVYSYSRASAVKEIRDHLRAGKPVIIKANSNSYKGVRLGHPHHALVLVSIDSSDRVLCISPGDPRYYKNLTLSRLLYHHMTPASGDYTTAYMTNLKTAGGYILVG